MSKKLLNVRVAAAEIVANVCRGQSLSTLLPAYSERVEEKDRPLLKEISFGCLRWYPQISLLLKQLIKKPLREKDLEIHTLIACGIYQLMHMRISDHAVVNETVTATKGLSRPWAKGLVNAVLRNFQREMPRLMESYADQPVFLAAHPKWLLKKLELAWSPAVAADIVSANNLRAPMTLRVNARRNSRDEYLAKLQNANIGAKKTPYSDVGIVLDEAIDVAKLPGFVQGDSSVQDEAAQLACSLLELSSGQIVLDACCAPGGKTCHILESELNLQSLVAVDSESRRLTRVEENLSRLSLQAKLVAADVSALDTWWDKTPFDRILLDAPCSATGVIRRHPDIKILRKPADIDKLAKIQLRLIESLWQTLENEGILVYATCSVLPEENDLVVKAFVQSRTDVEIMTIDEAWGVATVCGRQLFPAADGHDGFYYAKLRKTSPSDLNADNKAGR